MDFYPPLFFFIYILFMRPIVEYLDYRKYILDFYKERKERSGFTWRSFSEKVGFKNPVYLKQICDGKYNLNSSAVDKIVVVMELKGYEIPYFSLLVNFAHAKTEGLRQRYFEQVVAFIREFSSVNLKDDAFNYFESWKNPVVREIASAMTNAKTSEIAEACIPAISVADVEHTLQFLERIGLLQKKKNGAYVETKKVISMINREMMPIAATKMQQDMAKFAEDAIVNIPSDERNISGLTMGISEKQYLKIVEELVDFRKKIISIVSEDKSKVERVYRLNLQLFPLSKKL